VFLQVILDRHGHPSRLKTAYWYRTFRTGTDRRIGWIQRSFLFSVYVYVPFSKTILPFIVS
jgi:hypothetical protein